MTIEIQLTRGYVAIVDDVDSDLADISWHPSSKGYAITNINKYWQGQRRMHRAIYERVLGRELERAEEVDHKNGDKLNNCRSNLRLATRQEQSQNRTQGKNSLSGLKGVSWVANCKKWQATILHEYLGVFENPLEAHRTYCIAALTHYGEFANFGSNSPFTGWKLADFDQEAR